MSMVNKWIMVVDDKADTMNLIDTLLRRQCMAVIKASNAELALHLVKSMRPDAFVVDEILPDMSGLDLCRALRSTPLTASIPIILLAAHDNMKLRKQAFDAGANEFVNQLTLPEDLPVKIANLLAKSNGHVSNNTSQKPSDSNGVSAVTGSAF